MVIIVWFYDHKITNNCNIFFGLFSINCGWHIEFSFAPLSGIVLLLLLFFTSFAVQSLPSSKSFSPHVLNVYPFHFSNFLYVCHTRYKKIQEALFNVGF